AVPTGSAGPAPPPPGPPPRSPAAARARPRSPPSPSPRSARSVPKARSPCPAPSDRVASGPAAIDGEALSVDVARRRRGEEQHGPRDLLRLAGAIHRDMPPELLCPAAEESALAVEERARPLAHDGPRRDGIVQDAVMPQ